MSKIRKYALLKTGTHTEEYVDYVFRCIDPDFLIPAGRPLICEYNRHNSHTYISKCCKDKDLCNADLNLKLAPITNVQPNSNPSSTTGSSFNSSVNLPHSNGSLPLSLTVLLPSCIIAALLLFALFILAFIFRRKDIVRIKCLCFECVHRGATGNSPLNLNGSSTTTMQSQSR